MSVIPGSTDNRVRFIVYDKVTREPASIAYNVDGLAVYYQREGAAPVSVTLAAGTGVDSAHSDGAWNVITSGDGWHQLDVPDAAFAAGVNSVVFGATADDYILIAGVVDLVAPTLNGSGARSVNITVDDGTEPIQGAIVRLTSGVATYKAETNASGVATLNVDDATWAVAITKAGYSYAGTTLVVDGDETPTYSMTQVVITPSEAGFSTGYATVYDENGDVESGVSISCKCVKVPDSTGKILDSTPRTETSGVDGLVQFDQLIRGATYSFSRNKTASSEIVPDAETFELTSFLGSE